MRRVVAVKDSFWTLGCRFVRCLKLFSWINLYGRGQRPEYEMGRFSRELNSFFNGQGLDYNS